MNSSRIAPTTLTGLIQSAMKARVAGDLARANQLLSKALEKDPRSLEGRLLRAQILQETGNSGHAVDLLKQIFAENPKLDIVLTQVGRIFLDRSDFEKAHWYFDKAVKLNPSPLNYCNRAQSRIFLGNFDDARSDVDRSLEKSGDHSPIAFFTLGFLLGAQQKFEAADSAFSKAIQQKPDFVDALVNRGATRVSMRQYQAGIADYRKALSIQPKNLVTMTNLGAALIETGDFDAARMQFEHALATHGQTPDVRWGLALTELSSGNYDKGWKWYDSRV